MQEGSVLIRTAIGVMLISAMLAVGTIVVVVSMSAGEREMDRHVKAVESNDFSMYDGVIVDAAIGRNIVRANKGRLPIVLGSGTPDAIGANTPNSVWVVESTVGANEQINNYFFPTTTNPPANLSTHRITIRRDDNNVLYMWVR